ncbi:exodeoxyribonuclease III [Spirosoma montaniterrae]|uniref:Exodeoxyribonuclease III n=1 Tax=Spirosoma montaniterrae TaxID=1178516 RepID=A0A1P9WTE2_9BACT|nr:exodeoxyribonuclease III [Spirosoma montaniterrae]AQG78651.1 exodeoxyribonuclease III [Spirosoma montaniterrae]
MQLISYNINGIRAAMRNGLIDWLAQHDFDILCFQEVKATADVVDLALFEQLGYQYHWHAAEKKGYSGVATFSKIPPTNVVVGCGLPVYDCEGRILRTDFEDITLLNCYFPSGTSGETRQSVKMEFLRDFFDYVQNLRRERPNLIVVGDYNIAHTERDIHDPVRNKNTTGFLPEERAWMDDWFGNGMVDAFRYANPDKVAYSWWSYRAGARANNKGWRIDYASVSEPLRPRIRDCQLLPDAVHADHCPVQLSLNQD